MMNIHCLGLGIPTNYENVICKFSYSYHDIEFRSVRNEKTQQNANRTLFITLASTQEAAKPNIGKYNLLALLNNQRRWLRLWCKNNSNNSGEFHKQLNGDIFQKCGVRISKSISKPYLDLNDFKESVENNDIFVHANIEKGLYMILKWKDASYGGIIQICLWGHYSLSVSMQNCEAPQKLLIFFCSNHSCKCSN